MTYGDNTKIITLSINDKEFISMLDNISSHLSEFEKNINSIENKINKLDINNFNKINSNMSSTSSKVNKEMKKINNSISTLDSNMQNLSNKTIDSINNKFTIMGRTAFKVVDGISDRLINVSKNLVRTMTDFDNMSSAMSKYEQKNVAIRTIMNSITDDQVPKEYAKTIDYVTDALSKLETFSDETSYDFTQMTQSIGKFVSMGDSLEKAASTVLGMANWSSLVGKSASDFGQLSYAMEKVASLGYMGLQQYQMVSTYMDPQTKKNLLEEAVAVGNLKKVSDGLYETLNRKEVSLESFSSNLKTGWLDMNVFNGVMGKYSEFANAVIDYMDETGATASEAIKTLETQYDKVSVKAFKSAQEAKTFGEAIESVKVAVTTGWAKSFEYIFGNVEEASKTFTDLANTLYDVFAGSKYVRNELLSLWKGGNSTKVLLNSFKKMKKDVTNIAPYINALGEQMDFFGLSLDEAQEKIKDSFDPKIVDEFNSALNETEQNANVIKNLLNINSENGRQNLINSILGDTSDYARYIEAINDEIEKNGITIEEAQEKINKAFDTKVIEKFNNAIKETSLEDLIDSLDYGFLNSIIDIVNEVKGAIADVFGLLHDDAVEENYNGVVKTAKVMIDISKKLNELANKLKPTEDQLQKIRNITASIAETIKTLGTIGLDVLSTAFKLIRPILGYFFRLANLLSKIIYKAVNTLGPKILYLKKQIEKLIEPILNVLSPVIEGIYLFIYTILSSASFIIDILGSIIDKVSEFISILSNNSIFTSFLGAFEQVGNAILTILGSISTEIFNIFRNISLDVDFSLDDVIKNIGNVFSNAVQNIINVTTDLFGTISTAIQDELNKPIDIKSGFFKFLEGFIGVFKFVFGKIKSFIKSFLQSIGLLDEVQNIVKKMNDKFSNLLTGILDEKGYVSIEKIIYKITNKIKQIFTNFKNWFNSFTKEVVNPKNLIGKISNIISDIINWFSSILSLLDNNALITLSTVFIVVTRLKKFTDNIFETINTINTVKIKKQNTTNLILGILAVSSIVAALYLLSKVNFVDLMKAFAALSITTLVLGGLHLLFNRLLKFNNIKIEIKSNIMFGLLTIAIFIAVLVKSVKTLYDLVSKNFNTFMITFSLLTALIVFTVVSLNNIVKNLSKKKEDNKFDIKSVITFVTDIIKSLSLLTAFVVNFSWENMAKVFMFVIAGMITLIATIWVFNKIKDKLYKTVDDGNNKNKKNKKNKKSDDPLNIQSIFGNFNVSTLTAMSSVIKVLTSAIKSLAELPLGMLITTITGISVMFSVLGIFGEKLSKLTSMFYSLSLLLLMISISVNFLDPDKIGHFGDLIGAMAIGLIILSGAFAYFKNAYQVADLINRMSLLLIGLTVSIAVLNEKGKDIDKIAPMLMGLFLSISIGASILAAASKKTKNINNLSKVLKNVSLMIAAIGAALLMSKDSVSIIPWMMGLIATLTVAIMLLVNFASKETKNINNLSKVLNNISLMIVAIGAALLMSKDSVSIIPWMMGLIATLTAAIWVLVNFASKDTKNINNLSKVLNNISLMIVAIGAALLMSKDSVSVVPWMIGLIIALTAAMWVLVNFAANDAKKVDNLVKMLHSLSLMILAIGAALFMVQGVSNALTSILALVGTLAAFGVVLYLMKQFKIDEQAPKILLFAAAIVLLSVALVQLSGIDIVNAGLSVLILAGAMAVMMVVANFLGSSVVYILGFAAALLVMAAALYVGALAIEKLSQIDYSKIVDGIKSLAENIDSIIVAAAGLTALGIASWIEGVGLAAKGAGLAVEGMGKALNGIGEGIGKAVSGVGEGIGKAASGLGEGIGNFFKGGSDADLMLKKAEALTNIANSYEKIKNIENELNIDNTIADKCNKILDLSNSLHELGKKSGSDYVQGIIEGMLNRTSILDIEKSVSGIANSITNTFNKILGIHSPSRVGKDEGGYYVSGIVEGVETKRYLTEEEVKELGITMKENFDRELNDGETEKAIEIWNKNIADSINTDEKIEKEVEIKTDKKNPVFDFFSNLFNSKNDKKTIEVEVETSAETDKKVDALSGLKDFGKQVAKDTMGEENYQIAEDVLTGKKSVGEGLQEAASNFIGPKKPNTDKNTKKSKKDDGIKAHENFLKKYEKELKTENSMIKYYANQKKKIWEDQNKVQVDSLSNSLQMNEYFTAEASKDTWEWVDTLAAQYEAADASFNDYLKDLDENISAEDRSRARRLETIKKFKADAEIEGNSGFNWGEASTNKAFEQKSSEVKKHEAISNLNSYLDAYKGFRKDIEYFAGTNISKEFLTALYKSGPNGDLFLAAQGMADNQLEELDAAWSAVHGMEKNGDEEWFTILQANRSAYQAKHVRLEAPKGSSPDNPFTYKAPKQKSNKKKKLRDGDEVNDENYEDYLDQEQENIKDKIEEAKKQNEDSTIVVDALAGPNVQLKAQEAGFQAVTGISQGITNAMPALQQAAANVTAVTNDAFGSTDKEEGIHKTDTVELTTLVTGMQEQINTVSEAVTALMEIIPKLFSDGMDKKEKLLENIGANVDRSVAKGIVKNIGYLVDGIQQMAQRAIETAKSELGINSPSTEFYQIGEYMIEGLALGIENGESTITNALVKSVLQRMHKSAEEFEEINSPSKKWAKFGSFIDEGLAIGIADNASSPLSALSEMLSGLSDDMEYSDDFNPVITPVLDLDMAKKQSKGISTLFAKNQAMNISSDMSASRLGQNEGKFGNSKGNTFTFTQNNYSPKELSRSEIYRQTNNQFSQIKTLLDH